MPTTRLHSTLPVPGEAHKDKHKKTKVKTTIGKKQGNKKKSTRRFWMVKKMIGQEMGQSRQQ
jgi:hypothetical protein